MKYAICYLSVGDQAMKLLDLSIKTLRKAGFDGDIHVMTTSNTLPFKHDVALHTLKEEHLNLDLESDKPLAVCDVRRLDMSNPRNAKMYHKFAICHAKTLMDKYVPFDQYEYIVYLDIDILVQAPLKKFENFLEGNNGKIITATSRMRWLGGNPLYLSRHWFRPTTVTAHLTKMELFKYWHKRPLCADILCFPTTKVGKDFLQTWQKECMTGKDSDQSALQAVLLRHYQDIHMQAPHNIFGYGADNIQYEKNSKVEKQNTVFVHFNGAMKNPGAMNEYYIKYLSS